MTDITPSDAAEKAIDFIEELGYPLQPWQATTLRAMLTYRAGQGFIVGMPPQHPQSESDQVVMPLPGMTYVQRDGKWVWEKPVQRKGFQSDHVVMDEGCTCFGTGYESYCPVHGNRGA